MNGGTLKGAPEVVLQDREIREERASLERDELRRAFAAALMQTVPVDAQRLPRLGSEPEADPASTAGWRPTDVSMTEFGDSVAEAGAAYVGAGQDEKTTSLVTRLSTAVNTADLGKVSFIVDRSNSGLSIVVEVESEAAFRAVEADKHQLFGTLRAAGMTLLSFRILNRGGSGTGVALKGFVSDAKTPHFTRLSERRLSDEEDADDGVRALRTVG